MPCLEAIVENDAKKRARLLDRFNRSFSSSVLSKMLHMSCDENLDPLGSGSFGNSGAKNFESKAETDDELTSLAWLQDSNLLKNINACNKCTSPQPQVDLLNRTDQQNVAYDALLHSKHKPPYSFSCLIFMAIEASPKKCLPVKGIYDWIVQTFPYFCSAPTGWRNSVRHNLSLNKCFRKVDRDCHLGLGKGSSWCIDPVHRPNLLAALRKTPYHPFQQLQMVSSVTGTIKNIDECSINEVKEVHEKLAFTALITRKNNCKDANKLHGGKPQQYKRQSAFADVGKIRERIMQDIRLCNDSDDLICTAYPNEDHIYSIPGLVLEETRTAMDISSVDKGLDLRSSTEQEDDDPVADDVESESSVDLTDELEKGSILKHRNRTKASCNRSKTAGNRESSKTECTDDDKNDEQKMLYFTSLALLELAAGRQPISIENEVQERSFGKRSISRKKKFERVHQPCARVSKRGRRVSVALQECASKNNNEALVTRQAGKRKCKQLLPINSSLWGKRRKLPDNDVNLESLPKYASRKKLTSTRRRKIVRRRRK